METLAVICDLLFKFKIETQIYLIRGYRLPGYWLMNI